DAGAAATVGCLAAAQQLAIGIHFQRFPWIQHCRTGEISRRLWMCGIRCIDDDGAELRAAYGGRCGIVVIAEVAGLVLEPGVLPARAFALRLADQLQIAVVAFESGGSRRRRYLALQIRLGLVARAASGFGDRQSGRAAIGDRIIVAATAP